MKYLPKECADIIREKIEESSSTQAAIAERAGLEQGFLSRLKKGEKRLDIEKVCAIAEALGVLPGDLMPPHWFSKSVAAIDMTEVTTVIRAVLDAYKESTEEIGHEHATTEQLAKIAAIYIEDRIANVTPSLIKSNVRLIKN